MILLLLGVFVTQVQSQSQCSKRCIVLFYFVYVCMRIFDCLVVCLYFENARVFCFSWFQQSNCRIVFSLIMLRNCCRIVVTDSLTDVAHSIRFVCLFRCICWFDFGFGDGALRCRSRCHVRTAPRSLQNIDVSPKTVTITVSRFLTIAPKMLLLHEPRDARRACKTFQLAADAANNLTATQLQGCPDLSLQLAPGNYSGAGNIGATLAPALQKDLLLKIGANGKSRGCVVYFYDENFSLPMRPRAVEHDIL